MDENESSTKLYQILTSFPNDNSKHIDYVLIYRDLNDTGNDDDFRFKCRNSRKKFFDRLAAESFEIYNIDVNRSKSTYTYVLLHCKTDRLLMEAEHINLEMKLKTVSYWMAEISFFTYLIFNSFHSQIIKKQL